MSPKPLKLGTYGVSISRVEDVCAICLSELTKLPVSAQTLNQLALKPASKGLVRYLFKALNRWVPPYSYWGWHPSDKTLLGVWVDLGKLHAAEEWGKLVQATTLKAAKSGVYVLVPEGDGLTLYHRRTGREMWRTA